MSNGRAFKRLAVKIMMMTLIVISVLYATAFGAQQNLRIIVCNHPWTEALKPLIPEFEKQTGIKVNLEPYEENQLTSKLTVEFTSGASSIDVFMTRPLQEGRLFARNSWYHPLNGYLNKKDIGWNFQDFSANSIRANTYNNKLNAIPLVAEWQVVFYRKDLFEKAKLNPPTNFAELEAAAKTFYNPSAGMYGFVARGQRNAAVTQFSSYLYGFGGDFLKKGKCVLDTPQAIKAFKFYGKMLHDYGPPGATNMSWPQAQAIFASGNAAMWTDASTLISGLLAPDKSKVADKVGVAVFPTGPAGAHPFMVTSWALAMAEQSRNKDAAWQFIKWATSPELSLKAQLAGNTMARVSVWNNPQVLAKIHPDMAAVFKKTSQIATPYDRPLMTAVVEARDNIGDVMIESIETGGTGNIESMAKAATRKINDLLKKSGEFGK